MMPYGVEEEDYVLVNDSDDNQHQNLGEKPDVIANLKKWLQPTDYAADSSEYNKHLNAHVKGTGQWIRETEQYQKWHDTDKTGDLWIRSVPGAGKSVAAADLIRELTEHEDVPVLYFFFRQIVLSNQSPASFLRDACHQLLDFSPTLQTTLKNVKKKYGSITTLPFTEFFECFSIALTSMSKVYCVLDALDEMNLNEDGFISSMLNLGRRHSKSIKLVMTSRQLPYLERHFRDSCVVDLRLDRINVDKDIAKYVSFRLEQITSRIALDDAESIKTLICDRGRGLFLYARLMMDECIRDPQAFVSGRLPGGLGEMYTKLLSEHAVRSGTSQAFQSLVLGFVTHSKRPLRLIELTSAINTMPERKVLLGMQDTKTCIRNCCGPLLEVCEDEVLQIIHHSLTEYLTGSDVSHVQMRENDVERFPVLDASDVHASISIACLQYLASGVFDKSEVETRCGADKCRYSGNDQYRCYEEENASEHDVKDLTLHYPFVPYAINFWPSHAATVSSAKSTALYAEVDSFMQTKSHDFECWMNIWPGLASHVPEGFTPLHVAAHCGIKGYVEKLLLGSANVDLEDAFARTPMFYAAKNGRTELVDLLMQFGATTTHLDNVGLSAVHVASSHSTTLEALLRHGADPLLAKPWVDETDGKRRSESRKAKGKTILYDIASNGYVDSLRVFLTFVAESDIDQDSFFIAVKARKAQIVEVLLTLPWDVNRKDSTGKTALFHAAKNKDLPTIRLLLAAGADPNVPSSVLLPVSSRGWYTPTPRVKAGELQFNALHAWAGLDSGPFYDTSSINEKDLREVLELLVASGCNVNTKLSNGKTALFAWTHYSSGRRNENSLAEAFVSALLSHGADATYLDETGTSVLHGLHGYSTERKAAELLIAAGANINQQSTLARKTPLMNAAQQQLMDPSLFQDLGADFNLQDHCGNTAFHIAASSWCMEENHADLWLRCADPKILNNAGQMALVSFNWGNGGEGRVKAISKMVDLGMDIESRDYRGRTVLLQYLSKSDTSSVGHFVEELLRLGADTTAVDFDGSSALHLLSQCKLSNIDHGAKDVAVLYDLMKALTDKGCEINSRDYRGRSILQKIFTGEDAWPKVHIRAIAQLGSDMRGVDHDGRTLLHSAATMHHKADGSPRQDDGSASTKIDYVLDLEPKLDVNAKDNQGATPLMLAAQVSEISILKLIEAGADLSAVDNLWQNALHHAAAAGKPNIVDLLIQKFNERHLPIDACDLRGRSALHNAARSGKIESVSFLMAAGAKYDRRDRKAKTPLHAAAEFENPTRARYNEQTVDNAVDISPHPGDEVNHAQECAGKGLKLMRLVIEDEGDAVQIREVVRALIKAGLDAAVTDYDEHTAIDVALMLGNHEVAEELADVMRDTYADQASKLASLAVFNEALMVSKRKATKQCLRNLDFSKDRVTLLEGIFSHGDDALVQELVSLNVPMIEEDGSSAIHLAVRYGYTTLVAKALPHVPDVNAFHPPLLHVCIERETTNMAMFRLLVDAGVNLDAIRLPNDRTDTDDYGCARPFLPGRGSAVIHRLALGYYSWFPEALSFLLATGADVEIEDHKGVTPLETALSTRSASYYSLLWHAGYWSEQVLDVLLKHGANVNNTSSKGVTPLNKVISEKRSMSILQKLLDHGLDVAVGGAKALISAIEKSNFEMVKTLLEAGADPNTVHEVEERQTSRRTPLLYASTTATSRSGSQERGTAPDVTNIMELLLAHGADPSLKLDDDDTTVLHEIAAERGLITELLVKDCNFDERDAEGRTVFHRACAPSEYWNRTDNAQCVRTLLACGYDVNARDNNGDTPLHHILTSRTASNIETLLDHGASVTIKNNKGIAPLQSTFNSEKFHIWSSGTNRETIELLLKAGASPLERGRGGTTILHEIMSDFMDLSVIDEAFYDDRGRIEEFNALRDLYRRLISEGCNVEWVDDKGRTPIFEFVEAIKSYSECAYNSPPNPAHVRELFATHDIFHVDNEGEGLLHVVARREEGYDCDGKDGLKLWEILVELGLDPRLENRKGVTPLDVAAACGNSFILELYARKD